MSYERSADSLIARIRACRACELPAESYPIVSDYVGQRFFLLGQAPGKEELKKNLKFAGPAGRTLFKWFADVGMGSEDFVRRHLFICAVAHCWPGTRPGSSDDKPPSTEMRRNCRPHVWALRDLVNPDWVIALGGYAQKEIFGRQAPLRTVVGQVHEVQWGDRVRKVIALPHPSGLSRWLNDPHHRELHEKSLQALSASWRAELGDSVSDLAVKKHMPDPG